MDVLRIPIAAWPALFVAALCSGLFPSESLAQAPNELGSSEQIERVTLAEAIRRVGESSIELQLAREEFAAVQARLVSAGARPNPILSATREDLSGGTDGYAETVATLGQPIEVGGQRGLRRDVASGAVEAGEARLSGAGARLALEVREAYVRTAAAGEILAVLEETVGIFRSAEESGTARFAEGDISRFALDRLQVERFRYEMLVADASLDLDAAARELTLLVDPEAVGRSLLLPAEPLADIPVIFGTDAIDYSAAAAGRAEVRVAQGELNAAQAALDLQRRFRIPTLTLSGGFKHQSDDFRGVVIGVSLPLPLWDQNRGRIEEAAAELSAAALRREMALRNTEMEIRRAEAVRRSLADRIDLLGSASLEEGPGLLETARLAYAEGEMSLVELLDAADAHRGARYAATALLEEYLLATYRLEYAAGRLPAIEPIDTGDPR